ncbi:unnamed protein product [Acanthoscelides obtectus]|uniref:RNA-binding protein Musashi homolog Rbp6 n=1 Tax=Acanthoscelides obtectus TaxID=200917 RepID=A0A9P0JKA4_ACAOB|nr:unnamed protein product [Acanthoscelides obtectus]CAK1625052.1 RNA-binding protein Musashi homolog Rbp6 [Acanthoscelides obtectus]
MVECKKAQPKEVMLPANLAKSRAAGRGAYDFMWSLGALPDGFPAAAYAAYATGRGYSGYPSFGLPYPTVMNNYQAAAAAAAQGFGPPPASPHAAAAAAAAAAGGRPTTGAAGGGFPAANSPGPTQASIEMYNGSAAAAAAAAAAAQAAADSGVGYVQAASPQPNTFPAIAVSRAPLNYSPGPLIPAAFTNGYH